MTNAIQPPKNQAPLNMEMTEAQEYTLALQVLQLLDGLAVGQVLIVLKEAASIMNNFTRHDCSTDLFVDAMDALTSLPAGMGPLRD